MKRRNRTQLERGVGLAEFTIGALVFFMSLFAVLECCRLLWTHNALADATRRGARYAALNTQNVTNVKNFVVYGTASPAVGAAPVVYGLTTSNVAVSYSGFGVKQGTVTVQITSVVRASDTSFNVRWTERRYANGAAAGLERWTAVVSIVLQTPRSEERLRRNPLGIYVNGLAWSRELDSSEGVKP